MELIERISINEHSSIRVESATGKVIYFDPYNIPDVPSEGRYDHDADIICVTHSHYDHFSPEDISKIIKEETVIVAPKSMSGQLSAFQEYDIVLLKPKEEKEILDFDIRAVPAYNIGKPFHPKHNEWIGYVATIDDKKVYVCGDTDLNEDAKNVECDILLVPCGGMYTMDYKAASELANILKPEVAVPTHYGTVAGKKDCGRKFAALVQKDIKVVEKYR